MFTPSKEDKLLSVVGNDSSTNTILKISNFKLHFAAPHACRDMLIIASRKINGR